MNVTLDMQVEEPDTAPGALGRDACRIVREALTNVSKHARGTAVTVSVSGRAGSGLLVTIRNRLPIGQSAGEPLPGAGLGLVGLAERVGLSGGTRGTREWLAQQLVSSGHWARGSASPE
jgi:signal transduction histidine kinase